MQDWIVMHAFYDFIMSRRSVRQYLDKPVSKAKIIRILEAGMWAPSAHNSQPWRFFILQTEVLKEKLAKVMCKVFRRDLEKDGKPPELIRSRVQTSIQRFSKAPVLIVAGLTMSSMDSYADEERQQAEYTMAVQSIAAAIQNILLAVHSEGLAACWFCAPLFCPKEVQEILKISENIIPQALITIGYAAEFPEPPLRFQLKTLVTFCD